MDFRSIAVNKDFLRLVLILAAMTLPVSRLSGQVSEITPPPSPEHPIVDVFFTDEHNGWFVSAKEGEPFLFRTLDSGNSWQRIKLHDRLSKVFFLNTSQGWAISRTATRPAATQLFRTKNGGRTWTRVTSVERAGVSKDAEFGDVLFTDSKHGILVATEIDGEGLVLRTSDGGRSFKKIEDICSVKSPLLLLGDFFLWRKDSLDTGDGYGSSKP